MRAITLAKKDLLLLFRQRSSMFFTFAWPIMIAVFFGIIFSGGGGGSSKPLVGIVDLDQSAGSADFIKDISALKELQIDVIESKDQARELVRTRKRTAAIIIPQGYGLVSQQMFFGSPPTINVLIDPSRKAEEAMIKGMLQGMSGEALFKKLTDPEQTKKWMSNSKQQAQNLPGPEGPKIQNMLMSIEDLMDTIEIQQINENQSTDGTLQKNNQWQPLLIVDEPVQRQRIGPANSFSITFPQGMLWAIIGCIMTFATSLVLERVNGTFLRLRSSPMANWEVMAGKAAACFCAIILVVSVLVIAARFGFNVQPNSWPLLLVAAICSAIAFTGIMMFISSIGSTVSSVSGAGWAIMMPLMMLGGGMIPLFMMPSWLTSLSAISPVKWAILALEGAIWREFSFQEMLFPSAILLSIGIVFFMFGTWLYARRGL